MKSDNLLHYNNFDVEELIEFVLKLGKQVEKEEKDTIVNNKVITGRKEAIMFIENVFNRELTDKEKEELKLGLYQIDNLGIQYIG